MAIRADDVDLGRDRVLVEQCQAGDLAAFEDLYRRYFPRLYRFCLKRVGDRHEAEELAQEAFTRAYRAMPGFQGERRFYPWLSVIASRLCVDSHRRRGRSAPAPEVDLGVVEGGQEQVVDEVDRQLLATAVGRLGPRHREVLRMREEEGWSYQRIADELDVNIGTVEALLFRARRALRREFLAVAGADARWAGVPVLGWALRRWVDFRIKIEDALTPALPALTGAAVSIAVVAGGAAGGLLGAGPRPATPTAGERAVISVANAAGGSVRFVDAVAPAGAAVNAAPAPRVSTMTWIGPIGTGDEQEARDFNRQAPISAEAGPVSVGVDPGEMQSSFRTTIDSARTELQQ